MASEQLTTRPFELRYPGQPGRVVRGRVTRRAGRLDSGSAVLLLHGFKGFMDWGFFPELARRIAGAGLAAVAFNTSGSGIGADLESFSELEAFARDTYLRQLEDIELVHAALDAGELLGGEVPRSVGLFGHSRGGGLAFLHAARAAGTQHPVRALVTWSAIDDCDRFDAETKRQWRAAGRIHVRNQRTGQDLPLDVGMLDELERNREQLDILRACRSLHTPTLLIHGSSDESVAPVALLRLARAFPAGVAGTLSIPGGNHTFGAVHPLATTTPELERALSETVQWFERHLGV